jgi:thiol-disulfide isomerase/thioredoxin
MVAVSLVVAALLLQQAPTEYDLWVLKRLTQKSPAAELAWDRAFNTKGTESGRMQLKGKVRVLFFWDAWCEPCKPLLPEVEALHRSLQDSNVEVLGVTNHGGSLEPAEAIRITQREITSRRLTFPTYFKNDDENRQRFLVEAIPEAILVGADGRVLAVGMGAEGLRHVSARVVSLRAGERP